MRFSNILKTLSLSLFWSFVLVAPFKAAHAKAIDGVVNINTATPSELMMLPGIGKAKADQIVQLRQAKPFASADDLKAVKGLGAKRLEALQSHITVSGPTTAKAVASPKASVQPVSATTTNPGNSKI